jgi:hypothetical protein
LPISLGQGTASAIIFSSDSLGPNLDWCSGHLNCYVDLRIGSCGAFPGVSAFATTSWLLSLSKLEHFDLSESVALSQSHGGVFGLDRLADSLCLTFPRGNTQSPPGMRPTTRRARKSPSLMANRSPLTSSFRLNLNDRALSARRPWPAWSFWCLQPEGNSRFPHFTARSRGIVRVTFGRAVKVATHLRSA